MNLKSIEKFLTGPVPNAWIEVDTFKIYVRKGLHNINEKVIETFDLASFEQARNKRSKGAFRQLVTEIKTLLENNPALLCKPAPGSLYEKYGEISGIYVENVLNERLAKSLPSMGFKPIARTEPPCFYLPLTKPEDKIVSNIHIATAIATLENLAHEFRLQATEWERSLDAATTGVENAVSVGSVRAWREAAIITEREITSLKTL